MGAGDIYDSNLVCIILLITACPKVLVLTYNTLSTPSYFPPFYLSLFTAFFHIFNQFIDCQGSLT